MSSVCVVDGIEAEPAMIKLYRSMTMNKKFSDSDRPERNNIVIENEIKWRMTTNSYSWKCGRETYSANKDSGIFFRFRFLFRKIFLEFIVVVVVRPLSVTFVYSSVFFIIQFYAQIIFFSLRSLSQFIPYSAHDEAHYFDS